MEILWTYIPFDKLSIIYNPGSHWWIALWIKQLLSNEMTVGVRGYCTAELVIVA
jgi:hypothetical protein